MINTKYAVVNNNICVIVDVEEKFNVYNGDVEQHLECCFFDTGREVGYAKIYTSDKKYKIFTDKEETKELVDLFQLVD